MKPLEQLTLLEAGTALGVIVAVIGAVWTFVAKVWPVLRQVTQIAEDWTGEKARPGVKARPGIMERLSAIEDSSASAAYNSKPNSGHSAYDTLNRKIDTVVENTEQLNRRMSASEQDRQALHESLDKISERIENNE